MAQSPATEIWIHGSCAAGGYGGWSYVIRASEAWRGAAGGASRTDAEAMTLSALATALEALADAPRAPGLLLHLTDPRWLEAADGHGELRARITKALASWPARPAVRDARSVANAEAWSAFLSSWADFARDRAKTRGAFSAAIPKLNIAKLVQDAI